MTDNDNSTNDERLTAADAPSLRGSVVGVNDYEIPGDDEMDSDGSDSSEGDLTPNDIFGLDPLDVLTLEELADYLKVPAAAIRRLMKEQSLPGRNIGGEWRFLRDAVANWLRGQEAPVQQQQKAREDYAKPVTTPPPDKDSDRYSRPPQRPYQADQSGGGDYRARQRFPEGGQQYGNQRGGQSGGNQYGGNQYGGNQGQYGARQYGARQYGDGQVSGGQTGGGNYGRGNYGGNSGGGGGGGNDTRPPRRPFRSAEGGGEGSGGATGYGASGEKRGTGGYGGENAGGQFGGAGYPAGGQNFGGGAKRKNKRQVFDNERGKRLDRRKQDDLPSTEE